MSLGAVTLGLLSAKMVDHPPIPMHGFDGEILTKGLVVTMRVVEPTVVPEDQPLWRRGPMFIRIASQGLPPTPPGVAVEPVFLDDQTLRRRGRIQS